MAATVTAAAVASVAARHVERIRAKDVNTVSAYLPIRRRRAYVRECVRACYYDDVDCCGGGVGVKIIIVVNTVLYFSIIILNYCCPAEKRCESCFGDEHDKRLFTIFFFSFPPVPGGGLVRLYSSAAPIRDHRYHPRALSPRHAQSTRRIAAVTRTNNAVVDT